MAGLFGRGTPKPEPATRMPDPRDPRILEASRRKRENMMDRSGRLSTILSDSLREMVGSRGMLGS